MKILKSLTLAVIFMVSAGAQAVYSQNTFEKQWGKDFAEFTPKANPDYRCLYMMGDRSSDALGFSCFPKYKSNMNDFAQATMLDQMSSIYSILKKIEEKL